ncbi:hypothetical protein WJX82_011270 [Trebouxia sp. C0006]
MSRRPLPATDPMFEAGNWEREFKAREAAPRMSRQDEKMLMNDLEADALQCTSWGMRSSQQQCSTCHTVLATPYLLSLHVSEQHDSFFASQAAQRMSVFQCLVEGCNSRFCLAAQRHQHLTDFHQIPTDSGFDRIHLTSHHGQVRPDGIRHPTTADEVSAHSTAVQGQDLILDTKVQVSAAQMTADANRIVQDTGDQSCVSQNADMELALSAAVQNGWDSPILPDGSALQPAASNRGHRRAPLGGPSARGHGRGRHRISLS